MKNIQTFTDKTAIGLSLFCTIHCLVFPLVLLALPSINVFMLGGEALHLWIVLAVIPISTVALTLGCKRHRRYQVLMFDVVGLALLISAVLLGEAFLGETWEKLLTLAGASIIAYGHVRNHHLCQVKKNCGCTDERYQ